MGRAPFCDLAGLCFGEIGFDLLFSLYSRKGLISLDGLSFTSEIYIKMYEIQLYSFSFKFIEWFEVDEKHNSKVYVTNLPTDITEQEFVDFMQKCGLVLKVSFYKFFLEVFQ